MQRRTLSTALVAVLVVSLSGCSAVTTDATSSSRPTASPATSPTPTPTPTPTHAVVIDLDGLAIDGGSVISYDDGDGIVAALSDVYDSPPEEAPTEGPYGTVLTTFTWPGLRATLDQTRVSVVASSDGRASFATREGIGLGSTRAEAAAAGAEDEWDQDGDGLADYMKIGMREAPGTTSLVHPGEVGVEYISLKVVDDRVVEIASGGNDYSDL